MAESFEERLQYIFRETLNLPDVELNPHTSPADIPAWTSLNHVRLIAAIEKELQIQFTLDELMEMNSFGEIIDIVEKKHQP